MTAIRDRMLELATACVRLHDPDPDYLALVAPGEAPSTAASMGRLSGCGLVVRGLLGRLFGYAAPAVACAFCGNVDARLVAPYRFGQVMIDLRAMATEAKAWREGFEDPAQPGDVVWFEAPEHVAIVVDVQPDPLVSDGGPCTLYTIDGGQRLAGAEAVLRVERKLSMVGGRVAVVSPTARPIAGYIDLDALGAQLGGAS